MTYKRIYTDTQGVYSSSSQSLSSELLGLRNGLYDLQNIIAELDDDGMQNILSMIDNNIIPNTGDISIGSEENPFNVISSNTVKIGNSTISTNTDGGLRLPINTTIGDIPIGAIKISGSLNSIEELYDIPFPSQGDSYVVDGNLCCYTGTDWENLGSIHGEKGIQGIQGEKGEKGEKGPMASGVEILSLLADKQIHRGANFNFDGRYINLFSPKNEGYQFNGPSDIIKINLNILYYSNSSNPYEIITVVVSINNIPKFSRQYGHDMQRRVKDDFIIHINTGDDIQFKLHSIDSSNSPTITMIRDSFVTLQPLNRYHNIN